jgi:hypothetical protein
MEDSKKSKRIVWKPEVWDINKLKPYDKNPRIITEFGLDQLKDSFDEIGMAQPINVNTDGTILSGHARWQQLKKENYSEVQVMIPDRKLTPKQEEAVIVRMNKNTAGQWDFDILANEFDIDDLLEWGFNDSELMGISNLDKVNNGDENDEWVGMPEFEAKENEYKFVVIFENEFYQTEFLEKHKFKIYKKQGKSACMYWPEKELTDTTNAKYE